MKTTTKLSRGHSISSYGTKLSEIEAFFLDEIEIREQIVKKMKQFNTITGIVDTGLITSTVIIGGISITAAFAAGVGLLVGFPLSGTSYFFPLQLLSHKSLLKCSR